MRVTHVITRLIVGGAQENTIASVLGLRRKAGLEVNLISGRSPGPEGSLESLFAGETKALTVLPELVRPVHPWQDFLALRRLTATFRSHKPDIVHTHSGKAGILGRLAAAQARVPVIIHTIHGPSFGGFQGAMANAVFLAAERFAGKRTTHFVAVADAMTEQYLAAGIGRRDDYTTILSGFDLKPFLALTENVALRANWGIAPEDIVIGKIARLCHLKGHDDLFAAAPEILRRCPRVKFLLVGDGVWRARFEQRTQESGLADRFRFTGLVPPSEIPGLVGAMDFLVHLSYREGLPRALPQALAAARPVVAYDCNGAREVCLHDKTGFLIPPGDTPALVEHVALLAGDPALRQRFGSAGREFVRERFSVERMVDELHALYLKLANR